MTETQETPAAMLLLAPSSKAADILEKKFELRKDGAARAVLAQGARANEALRAALAGGVSAVVLMSPPAVEALDEDGRIGEAFLMGLRLEFDKELARLREAQEMEARLALAS